MTHKALLRQLQISCLGLDHVDPLRLLVDDVIAALAQQEQEPVVGIAAIRTWFKDGRVVTQTLCNSWVDTTPPQRPRVMFPTMLRKMWSGSEVQAWLDENVNKENT
jgi:hypothetical protein